MSGDAQSIEPLPRPPVPGSPAVPPTPDAQDTQPLPDPLAQWVLASPESPSKRRRRVWPWILALLIVIALAVGAWFAGEAIARDLVIKTIREQVSAQLDLPPGQEIDVTVAGAVLPQLISGSLDDVTVSSDDVALGSLTGDVTVRAQGVPIRGDAPATAGSATVRLDEEQLRALLATVDGLPEETVSLADPNVAMSIELQFFGLTFPIGVALAPSAVDGDIVLSPAALDLGGNEISADDLRDRFGGLADTVLRDWTVCIAQYIPAGVTLTGIQVDGDAVVADLDIVGGIVTDPALQALGTCD